MARSSWGVAVLFLFGLPSVTRAQWLEPPGRGWVALAIHHQDTRDVFAPTGERVDFVLNGRAVATSAYLTGAAGVVDGVDVWLQLSFHGLRFDDQTGRRRSTGFGDTRAWVRIAPLRWLGLPVPVAVRGGAKLPVGDFDVDTELIPLGDGQRDWELLVEIGRSFYPLPLYAMGWIGYRWREEDTEGDRDFGDERFFFVRIGGSPGPVGVRLTAEGWSGRPPRFGGLSARGQEREMIRIEPAVTLPLGPGEIEAGLRVPLAGKNLPAGTDLAVGYFARWPTGG